MKHLTQFELDLDGDFLVKGEYEGNINSGKVVVFVHGFGMKRDSRGFFTEIGDSLKDNYLVVKFDLCKVIPEENATLTYSFSTQAEMLKKVVEYLNSTFNPDEINIIAHSMGCLVTGMASIGNINNTILLCSPPSKRFRAMQDYFSHKPGTEFNLDGISRVKRSDGSWTLIDSSFWHDLKSVNPPELIENMSLNSATYFIRALQDDVITDESYDEIKSLKEVKYLELPGDHNFKGEDREDLVKQINEILD